MQLLDGFFSDSQIGFAESIETPAKGTDELLNDMGGYRMERFQIKTDVLNH